MDPSLERARERFRRAAPKFFVPTLRVQVLGSEEPEKTSSVVRPPPRRALEAEKPSLVLRPRAWTRPWKEQESGSGALRPSSSFRRFASRFLVEDHEKRREDERDEETGMGFGV